MKIELWISFTKSIFSARSSVNVHGNPIISLHLYRSLSGLEDVSVLGSS
jgi:hypothetical protein